MSEKEIDKTIEEIMKEMRASPDYHGTSCSAHDDSQCSHDDSCSPENPKRLKKGIHCGEKPQCEQNQIINESN
ncbi:MAG: hypothetical protein ACXACX_20710 [Candidatus Hodarchaeales archaeon]|jgi:hypothetical protein